MAQEGASGVIARSNRLRGWLRIAQVIRADGYEPWRLVCRVTIEDLGMQNMRMNAG